jgi:NAD(P)-dependent dehydrogenase (short-subunit alcohol dehydrogenase family)
MSAVPGSSSLEGRVVLVTGGGRGIGRACAELLAHLGAVPVDNDTGVAVHGDAVEDEHVVDHVAQQVEVDGGTALSSRHDLSEPARAAALVEWILSTAGRLDGLIHCAGITVGMLAHETDPIALVRLVNANLWTALNAVHASFRVMRRQAFGRIALVSSGSALFGAADRSAYAATKGGLIGLTRCLGHEARHSGVTINAVVPVALTRMAVSGGIPETATVAPIVVGLVDAGFDGSGGIYSAHGGSLARVGITLTEVVEIRSVAKAVNGLALLRDAPAPLEPRGPLQAMQFRHIRRKSLERP